AAGVEAFGDHDLTWPSGDIEIDARGSFCLYVGKVIDRVEQRLGMTGSISNITWMLCCGLAFWLELFAF
ncbi:hypothetical protein, partial [Mesorhizobium sp.]|uniref:hypothetical protein n=1 Tax=Mesorhizobium sp. TaxID=1871066 RepID=UPI0025D9621F